MLLLDKNKALGTSHRGETICLCVIVPRDFNDADIGMCVPTDDCESMKSANYYHYMEYFMIHNFGKKQDPKSQEFKDQKVLMYYLNFLNEGYKSFGLNENQKASLVKAGSNYSYHADDLSAEEKDFVFMFTKHKDHFGNHGLDSIYNCSAWIKQHRKARKDKSAIYSNKIDGKKVFRKERNYEHGFFNGQAVNSKYAVLTNAFAKKWWDDNMARTNVKISADALRAETVIKPSTVGRADNWQYYEHFNEVSLSPSWFKNVYMKGLATTVYKSKTAFVASAKPLKVSDRITANGLEAYTVDIITSHDGIISMEKDLYYLVYQTKAWTIEETQQGMGNIPFRGNDRETALTYNNRRYNIAETINCASSNFRRAENVMSGRVQRNILNAIGV